MAFGSLAGALILAIVVAFFASRSITRPIAKLQSALRHMAGGEGVATDSTLDIRRDEIGDLARAVGAVRDALSAQATHRAENDARRAAAEREQLEGAAREREAAATETNDAVAQLGQALEAMADGDLAFRLVRPFGPALDTLRINFNNSADKLQSSLKAIGGNASSIDAGAAEISTASNDLARRTEQQAASLEETAAALDELQQPLMARPHALKRRALLLPKPGRMPNGRATSSSAPSLRWGKSKVRPARSTTLSASSTKSPSDESPGAQCRR
ncbi:hypothetical protein AJ87_44700 [Rhizobium yanglingense]|nr:hypothetical protein AJ87_44700 [Rhizobium yanglingense]